MACLHRDELVLLPVNKEDRRAVRPTKGRQECDASWSNGMYRPFESTLHVYEHGRGRCGRRRLAYPSSCGMRLVSVNSSDATPVSSCSVLMRSSRLFCFCSDRYTESYLWANAQHCKHAVQTALSCPALHCERARIPASTGPERMHQCRDCHVRPTCSLRAIHASSCSALCPVAHAFRSPTHIQDRYNSAGDCSGRTASHCAA